MQQAASAAGANGGRAPPRPPPAASSCSSCSSQQAPRRSCAIPCGPSSAAPLSADRGKEGGPPSAASVVASEPEEQESGEAKACWSCCPGFFAADDGFAADFEAEGSWRFQKSRRVSSAFHAQDICFVCSLLIRGRVRRVDWNAKGVGVRKKVCAGAPGGDRPWKVHHRNCRCSNLFASAPFSP